MKRRDPFTLSRGGERVCLGTGIRPLALALAQTSALLGMTALAQGQSVEPPFWIRQLGTSTYNYARATAPDASGGVFVGGDTNGSLGGANAGFTDAWLARYDSAGNQLWIRQLGTGEREEIAAAAPDGLGGVYAAGATGGNLGGQSAGGFDAWLARYDSTGNQLWIRQLGTSGREEIAAAAPDGLGGVYVGGATGGNLGGPILGAEDAWVARYDNAGNQVWIRQFPSSLRASALAAAPDGSGGVFVCGADTPILEPFGPLTAWITHYDSDGQRTFFSSFGWGTRTVSSAAAPDGSGGVYFGGWTYGHAGGPPAGGSDAWLARYDSTGNQLWLRQLGTSGDEEIAAAAPDGSGGVYAVGDTSGSLGGPIAGSSDAWLAHHDSAGNQLWITQLGTPGDDGALAAAADGSGGVHVGGHMGGNPGDPNAGPYQALLARWHPALWVDFAYSGTETGSFVEPFNALAEAVAVVPANGFIRVKTGSSSETGTFRRSCTIMDYNGPVTIGH